MITADITGALSVILIQLSVGTGFESWRQGRTGTRVRKLREWCWGWNVGGGRWLGRCGYWLEWRVGPVEAGGLIDGLGV